MPVAHGPGTERLGRKRQRGRTSREAPPRTLPLDDKFNQRYGAGFRPRPDGGAREGHGSASFSGGGRWEPPGLGVIRSDIS